MRTLTALACIVALVVISTGLSAQEGPNINTMTKSEMMATKTGLGDVKSTNLIEEREKGQFSSFSDLQSRVKGIGPTTIEKLKEKGVVCQPVE